MRRLNGEHLARFDLTLLWAPVEDSSALTNPPTLEGMDLRLERRSPAAVQVTERMRTEQVCGQL